MQTTIKYALCAAWRAYITRPWAIAADIAILAAIVVAIAW